MTKPLPATLLLLPLVAYTRWKEELEDNSSEPRDAIQMQFCLIGEKIGAHLKLERRFKSMGNNGAAGRFGDARRSLEEKEKALLQQMRNENPEMSVPQC